MDKYQFYSLPFNLLWCDTNVPKVVQPA